MGLAARAEVEVGSRGKVVVEHTRWAVGGGADAWVLALCGRDALSQLSCKATAVCQLQRSQKLCTSLPHGHAPLRPWRQAAGCMCCVPHAHIPRAKTVFIVILPVELDAF